MRGERRVAAGSEHNSSLPLAGGVGGGQRRCKDPTPLRLTSKLVSLAAPPASARGDHSIFELPLPNPIVRHPASFRTREERRGGKKRVRTWSTGWGPAS